MARWFAVALILTLAGSAPAEGRRLALLVGVRDYTGSDLLRNLKFTEADVVELADVFRKDGYTDVVELTQSVAKARNDPSLLPTATNIRERMKTLLAGLKTEDTVVVAFAGHGIMRKGADTFYFCPKGADLKDPTTMIAIPEVYAQLKGCKAGVRVLIADSCRNDPLAVRALAVPGLASVTRPKLPKPPTGIVALYSCSADQTAYESDGLKHGVFFYYLLEGLRGQAADGKNRVDMRVLSKFVTDKVPAHVRTEFGEEADQLPESMIAGSGAITILGGTSPAVVAKPEVPSRPKPTAPGLVLRGEALRAQRKFPEAIEVFDQALAIDARSYTALKGRGACKAEQGDNDGAVQDFTTALTINPSFAHGYYNRGSVLTRMKRLPEAIGDLSKAISLVPGNSNYRNNRGFAYQQAERFDDAIKDFTDAIALNPTFERAYVNRGNVLHNVKKDYKSAILDYNEAIQLKPDYLAAYKARANSHDALGQRDEAERDRKMVQQLSGKVQAGQ